MFENTTNFDLDDISLDTSFTPSTSSTQVREIKNKSDIEPREEALNRANYLENLRTISNKSINALSQNEKCRNITIPMSETKLDYVHNTKDTLACPSMVIKRKFPGPAGLLPEIGASNKSILQFFESEHFENNTKDISILSQQTNSVFEDGPWKEMSKDFHVESGESLLEKFDIKWIKRQAMKQLLHHKAPFLAAVIQNLDILDGKIPTINVTLKDCTGEIGGTILHSLYEEYSNYIRIGSVIVLKHFGVLSAGYNNHCLTITSNNLVSIYCLEKLELSSSAEERSCTQNIRQTIRKIVIHVCNIDDILNKYHKDVSYYQENRSKVNLRNLKRNYSSEVEIGSNFNNSFPVKKRPVLDHVYSNPSTSGLHTSCSFSRSTSNVSQERPAPLTEDILRNSTKKLKSKQSNVTNFEAAANAEYVGNVENSEKAKNCDSIVISSSQISVKPARIEHSEIWKNLLEGVDTESLFDDF